MSNKLQIIERQNDALHKLNEIAAISDITPKDTLKKALLIAKEYFGLEFGIVSHIVGEDYTVEVQSSPSETLYDGQHFALGSTYCKTTLELDDVLAITDVTKSKYIGHPCHKEFALISYIGAPIRVNSKLYGTINFSSPTARALEYDSIDDEFMRLLAKWAGSFLERQFAFDALSFEKKRFEMIFENNASGIILVNEICQVVMANKRFCEIIGFSKAELEGQNARIYYTDDASYEDAKQKIIGANKSSYLSLEHQLQRKDGKLIWCEFIGSNLELAEYNNTMIWSILDVTLEKELQQKIQQQAIMDYLTELYNRRYFTKRLEEELSKIKRDKSKTTSLMMFDLDKFKNINDTFGHLCGDEVLKKFADILKQNFRQADIIGRIGGEEFAAILPDTGISSTVVLANRIKDAVFAQSLMIEDQEIKFTVSIGVTPLVENDTNFDMAIARVDQALYLAKRNGRNRIEIIDI